MFMPEEGEEMTANEPERISGPRIVSTPRNFDGAMY
jgi:hypothetical protein